MKRPPFAFIITTAALLCMVMATSFFNQTVALLFIVVTGLLLYSPLIYFAKRIGSMSALYFGVMLIVSRVITLPLVYYFRDDFTEDGWTAIKKFDFSTYAYLKLILSDAFAVLLILIAALLIRKIIPRSLYMLRGAPRSVVSINIFRDQVAKYNIFLLLIPFILVNYLIFEFANANKIGITGIEPNQLPFRIGGVVYYYLKFLGPIALFFLIKNSKSKLLVLILSLLLIFVGASTLSRSTVAMWAVPIAFVAYRNCRSITLLFLVVSMVTVASIFTGIARNLMFIADGSAIDIDLSVRILDVAEGVIESIGFADFLTTIASLVARLGGGQELILGSQTVFPDFYFSLMLLLQIFLDKDFGVDYQSLVVLTHGFIPLEGTVAGIAYSGYMLAFMNSGFVIFILFACFTAAIINLNDALRLKILVLSQNVKLANGVCFVLNFIFFAMFMTSWYWAFVFLIITFVVVYKWLNGGKCGLRLLKQEGNR